MSEQRRQKRRHLIYNLEVVDRSSNTTIGFLDDLTQEGLMLISELDLWRGQVLDLEIKLPDVRGLNTEQCFVKAAVRWSRLDRNPRLRCVGLQFEPLDMKTAAVIALTIKLAAFADV